LKASEANEQVKSNELSWKTYAKEMEEATDRNVRGK
jgi:hypothetical protein